MALIHSINPTRRGFLGCAGAGALGTLTGNLAAQPRSATRSSEHRLPDLPYEYDALEPHLDEATVRLHHQKHHGGAVRGLNRTEQRLRELTPEHDAAVSRELARSLAYYGSSHVLHSLFWTNMAPQGGGRPDGDLAEAIERDFGSWEDFRSLFIAAADSAPASGWGLLAYHPMLDRLQVLQVADHENGTVWGAIPLLACDVWEHAYYLKYRNRRSEWTETFMGHLVDWGDVARRFADATKRG